MKKIPTLFVRDPDDRAHVLPQVTPGCEWVLAGIGTPSRKWDGTAVMLDTRGRWWARRSVKPGHEAPYNFQPEERDLVTGTMYGWEPIEASPFAALFADAVRAQERMMRPGTYELIGPKVNGNPEGAAEHVLVPHGGSVLTPLQSLVWPDAEIAWWDLREYLRSTVLPTTGEGARALFMEGIVWLHPDGRRAKLKLRDFPVDVESEPGSEDVEAAGAVVPS